MTNEHTPGPWRFYADLPSTEPNWHIVTNESRMRVLANVHIEPGNKTDQANARLIAAAPDMLAALQLAEPLLVRLGDFLANAEGRCDAVLAVRDALLKVRETA